MKARKRTLTFFADEGQIMALRRYARKAEDPQSVSGLIREAIAGYLARHVPKRGVLSRNDWAGGMRLGVGTGKTPPRIMLHLRDRRRLDLLRLQAKTLKGTHRTVGRVIRAAIDEYLTTHVTERRQFLEREANRLSRATKR
jgi:hypothetical protein